MVLDRIRTSVRSSIANMPQSSINERLRDLKRMNKTLRRLLDETPIIAPQHSYRDDQVVEVDFFHRDSHKEALRAYETIRDSFTCNCEEAHLSNLGCHCDSCLKPYTLFEGNTSVHDWELGLVFLQKQQTQLHSPFISTAVFVEPVTRHDVQDDRCARPLLE
jgi:hypothetical protein